MSTPENPARAAAKILRDAGLDVDQDVVDEYALFCATAVLEGKPLTPEARIIAALVKKLGGRVSISPEDLLEVRGLVIDGKMENGLTLQS